MGATPGREVRAIFLQRKRAILTAPETIKWVRERVPIRGDELVIRMRALGVCTSDCKTYRSGEPGYFGHELVGEVEVGRGLYPAGTRVAVLHKAGCGTCEPCRQQAGHLCERPLSAPVGYADRLLLSREVAERCLVPLPDEVEDLEAVYLDSLACACHAVDRMRLPAAPQDVLILGNGYLSMLFLSLLEGRGHRVRIWGRSESNNRFIKETLERADAITDGAEDAVYDACLDTTGRAARLRQGIIRLRRQGQLMCFSSLQDAAELDWGLVRGREIDVRFARYFTEKALRTAVQALKDGIVPQRSMIRAFDGFDQLESVMRATMEGKLIRGVIRIDPKDTQRVHDAEGA